MRRHAVSNSLTLRLLVTAPLIGFLLTAFGCGPSGWATPRDAAQKFLQALIVHDDSASYSLLSEKFKADYGITAVTWKPVMIRNPIRRDTTFAIKSESIEDDTATVVITTSRGSQGEVRLVREDRGWKVDYDLGRWYGLAPDTE